MPFTTDEAKKSHHSDSWDDDESIFSSKGKGVGRGRGKYTTELHNDDDDDDDDNDNGDDNISENKPSVLRDMVLLGTTQRYQGSFFVCAQSMFHGLHPLYVNLLIYLDCFTVPTVSQPQPPEPILI